MNIGRLFVALGVKGSQKAIGAVDGVRKSLKDTASVGLETKAAIFGAVYAMERLFAKSGQYGTDLTNFNATLGVSTKTLQQYQYAARQVGVSNESVEGSFRGLQSTMTKTLMGKGAPEGLARVAQVVASIGKSMSATDLNEFANDPSKLLQRLQEYAQLEKNAGLRNETLKSFGIGDDMIAALTRNAFKPEVMAKAPTYSDKEIKELDKANIAWDNLGNKIQMAVGHFNAAHGGQLVKDISKVADEVLKMTEAFMKLAEQLKLFQVIGKVFEGWGLIFKGITDGAKTVGGAAEDPKKSAKLKEDVGSFLGDMANMAKSLWGDAKDAVVDADLGGTAAYAANEAGDATKDFARKKYDDVSKHGVSALAFPGAVQAPSAEPPSSPVRAATPTSPVRSPRPDLRIVPPTAAAEPRLPNSAQVLNPQAAATPPTTGPTQNNNNNVTVNQNLNFQHDGKDAKQTGDSLKRATQNALRQMPGLAQGT